MSVKDIHKEMFPVYAGNWFSRKACLNAMKTSSSPSTKMFKVTPSAGKVMLTVFWDSQGVLLAHFQKHGQNVNSASYCEVLLRLRDGNRKEKKERK
jgi:hypothetical protein